jgi:hypothetical protein
VYLLMCPFFSNVFVLLHTFLQALLTLPVQPAYQKPVRKAKGKWHMCHCCTACAIADFEGGGTSRGSVCVVSLLQASADAIELTAPIQPIRLAWRTKQMTWSPGPQVLGLLLLTAVK